MMAFQLFKDVLATFSLDRLLQPWYRGRGVVLMFHRVLPSAELSNIRSLRGLEVSSSFFVEILERFSAQGFHWLSLDAVAKGLEARSLPSRFAVVTFDDGYRDNLEIAAPLLSQRQIPWTVFVTSGLIDGTVMPWWFGLGKWLEQSEAVPPPWLASDLLRGRWSELDLDDRYDSLRSLIHCRLADPEFMPKLVDLFASGGIELESIRRQSMMGWADVRALSAYGGSVGAHTVAHLPLARLSWDEAVREISAGRARIRSETGFPVHDFAYPFGDRDSCGPREAALAAAAGVRLAFTTRHGWLFPGHYRHQQALPRVNVSGHYLNLRHFESRLNGLSNLSQERGRRLVTV